MLEYSVTGYNCFGKRLFSSRQTCDTLTEALLRLDGEIRSSDGTTRYTVDIAITPGYEELHKIMDVPLKKASF